jgi:hypothetical protein
MKRITLLAVALGLCMIMAAPVMALDVEFSGQQRIRGYYLDKETMGKGTPDQFDRSYMDMRFRLQTIFKVNENISVTTRFDALDNKKFGDKFPGYTGSDAIWTGSPTTGSSYAATSSPDSEANVDFDRAYATIKTPVGGFLFGRMKDASWGTSFGDTEGDGDRLVYVVPIKNWIFAAVYEKWHEVDGDANNSGQGFALYSDQYGSDEDNDKYYLSATYRSEAFTAGLLYGYYRVNSFLDIGSASHSAVVNTNWATSGLATLTSIPLPPSAALYRRPVTADAHLLSPYISGRWGNLEVQAEATIAFGKADYNEYDAATYSSVLVAALGNTALTPAANAMAAGIANSANNNGKSRDLDLGQAMVDATYHIGPFAINAGYAWQSGGYKYNSPDDNKITGFGAIEQSGDWHKLWLLNGGNPAGDDNGLYQSLGGNWAPNPVVGEAMGNTGNFQGITSMNGFSTFWGGLDYAIMDNMTIGGIVGVSKAAKTSTGWDSNHGTEYDVNFIWDVYENLTWRITYAYLKAGDYWKAGSTTVELKDPYSFYTNIAVNF